MPEEDTINVLPTEETIEVTPEVAVEPDHNLVEAEAPADEAVTEDPSIEAAPEQPVVVEESGEGALPDVAAEVASEQSDELTANYKTGTDRRPAVGDVVAYGFWRGHVTEVVDSNTIKLTGLPAGASGNTFMFSYDGAGEFLGHAA